jgi:hypothetical protein
MQVTTKELREIMDRLCSHLEEEGTDCVELDVDLYWFIQKEFVYNPYVHPDPEDFTLGQLSEDWDNLKGIRDGSSPSLGYALVWLASIIRRYGEQVVA